jgi:hypothetical protein
MEATEINQQAPVVSRKEIVTRAPLDAVWAAHTDIPDWPTWNPAITRAELEGPLKVGAYFHWETEGLAISSTISEVIPGRRIVWSGTVNGILGIHQWTFTPISDGVLIHTEESWEGVPVEERATELQMALDSSLEAWLEHLKRYVERE